MVSLEWASDNLTMPVDLVKPISLSKKW
ncbi:protein of unknown function (plasmid) [Caballeronia sp. S22]